MRYLRGIRIEDIMHGHPSFSVADDGVVEFTFHAPPVTTFPLQLTLEERRRRDERARLRHPQERRAVKSYGLDIAVPLYPHQYY